MQKKKSKENLFTVYSTLSNDDDSGSTTLDRGIQKQRKKKEGGRKMQGQNLGTSLKFKKKNNPK